MCALCPLPSSSFVFLLFVDLRQRSLIREPPSVFNLSGTIFNLTDSSSLGIGRISNSARGAMNKILQSGWTIYILDLNANGHLIGDLSTGVGVPTTFLCRLAIQVADVRLLGIAFLYATKATDAKVLRGRMCLRMQSLVLLHIADKAILDGSAVIFRVGMIALLLT